MPEEILNADERDYALTREGNWKKCIVDIQRKYEAAEDKSSVINEAQTFIYENEPSLDPIIQGKLSAYEDFLKNLGLL
jgi:hypothetical protein